MWKEEIFPKWICCQNQIRICVYLLVRKKILLLPISSNQHLIIYRVNNVRYIYVSFIDLQGKIEIGILIKPFLFKSPDPDLKFIQSF